MESHSKRQFDPENPPIPHGGFGYYYYPNRTWMIVSASVAGGIVLLIVAYCLFYNVYRRSKARRARAAALAAGGILPGVPAPGNFSNPSLAVPGHARSGSGIDTSDPDNIKPVKRLRSFHMKPATNVSARSSPTTPTSSGGLFSRLFRRKSAGGGVHRRMPTLDEEMNASALSLNRDIDTPGLDEKMLESPPPTPAPAFGWNSTAGNTSANKRRSMSETMGENTAYKPDGRQPAPVGQGEKDGFLSRSSSTRSESGRLGGGRAGKRMSAQYDENYQSKPSDYAYFDDEEEKILNYNPDSRSGH